MENHQGFLFQTGKWRRQINEWIDKQRLKSLDDFDNMLIHSLKVTYITGKGNHHLVPLLILKDTVNSLDMLSDTEYRRQAGITDDK